MFHWTKRWFGKLLSAAQRIVFRLGGRPSGRWVEGSFSDRDRRFLFSLVPQSGRTYHLHLPGGYSRARQWPLLVMLHGCKQDARNFAAGTRMNRIADREGFLVLYPEQKRLANAFRCWNWFDRSVQNGEGEAALIAGMVRAVTAEYAVDPSRVYIAGMSAGAALTSVMVSCHGELFAACAMHSGLMHRAADSAGDAMRAMENGSLVSPETVARQVMANREFTFVPALVIHGTRDDVVHPSNADQTIAQFMAMARGIGETSEALVESVRRVTHGGTRPCEIRDFRSAETLMVRKVLIEELRHAWSGGDAQYAFNDARGPDASLMIWEFVSTFERRELAIAASSASMLGTKQ
ncbi:MAG: alpha/beta hydrolase family esterase [Burkholderiales bacterium]